MFLEKVWEWLRRSGLSDIVFEREGQFIDDK